MKIILKFLSSLLILFLCAGAAGFVVYSILTPEQQQKVRKYVNDRGRSYEPGPASQTFEKAKAHFGDLMQQGGERSFTLKTGETVTGKVNFETEEAYSLTLPDGNRVLLMKEDLQ